MNRTWWESKMSGVDEEGDTRAEDMRGVGKQNDNDNKESWMGGE